MSRIGKMILLLVVKVRFLRKSCIKFGYLSKTSSFSLLDSNVVIILLTVVTVSRRMTRLLEFSRFTMESNMSS